MAPQDKRPKGPPAGKPEPGERVASPKRPESPDERAWRGHGADADDEETPLPRESSPMHHAVE